MLRDRTTSTNGRNNASWTPGIRFNVKNHSAETQRINSTKKWYLIPPTNVSLNQIKNMIRHGIGVKSEIGGRIHSTQEHIKHSNTPTNQPTN